FHVFNYMSDNVRGFCCRPIQTFRPLPGGPGEQKDLGMSRRLARPFPFLSCRRELRHDTRPVPKAAIKARRVNKWGSTPRNLALGRKQTFFGARDTSALGQQRTSLPSCIKRVANWSAVAHRE